MSRQRRLGRFKDASPSAFSTAPPPPTTTTTTTTMTTSVTPASPAPRPPLFTSHRVLFRASSTSPCNALDVAEELIDDNARLADATPLLRAPAAHPDCMLSGGNRFVLLVEDDAVSSRITEAILRRVTPLGLTVDVAVDGLQACTLWREVHHPIVLMDLLMPVMDGIAATMRIRKEAEELECEEWRPTIVAVTGAPTLLGDDAKWFDTVLSKPVGVALRELVEGELGKRRLDVALAKAHEGHDVHLPT